MDQTRGQGVVGVIERSKICWSGCRDRSRPASRLPLQTQRGHRAGGLPLGDKRQLYHDSFGKLLALFTLLADEKVTLVAGTDAPAAS
jgi:hypothetical protein